MNNFEQEIIVESDNPAPSWASRGRSNNRRSQGYTEYSPGAALASVKCFFVTVGAVAFIIVLALGIWTVRGALPFVGGLAIVCAVILLACGVSWVVISVVRHATRADFYPVEENGAYLRNALGRVTPLAPMIAAPAKVNRSTAKVEISPAVPTLFDLIENGEIAPGEMTMVMGYDKAQLDKGILQLVIGAWPGTHAVAGKGRSGKTRRVIAMIAQALINGARVIVCDPHFTKLDSLARSLEPLEKYLTIARGEQEIVQAASEFLSEMEARVDDPNRPCLPWLIVFDEWSREMDEGNQKMPEGGRDILVDVAKNCSSQYAGYLGYCCIIGQFWTNEHAGGTDIRRSLQSAFIHQLSGEYAAFFFRAHKWQNRAEELKKRECIYRDTDNQVSEILTIGVPDDTAQRVAVYLASLGYQELAAPAQASAPTLPPAPYYQQLQERPGREQIYLPAPAPTFPGEPEDMPPLYPTSNGSTEVFAREMVTSAPEVVYGSAPEVARKRAGSNAEVQTEALRAVVKRLRAGESANDIRKSLGITGGRAMQEVNEALRILGEQDAQGE
jgi:hypothetical protein